MAKTYQLVGANTLKEKEYQYCRAALERERMDIVGVSPAVADFIEHGTGKRQPLEYSKLDVQNGTTQVDDSLKVEGKPLWSGKRY